MDERERPCAAPELPATLADGLAGYRWMRDRVGESGGAVYRLHGRPDAPDLYLKHGSGSVADDVTDEMARLLWLAADLPVPDLRRFVRAPEEAWLLMTAMPGRTAYQHLASEGADPASVARSLAVFLRRLHAIPLDRCPFNSDHAIRLARARDRMERGLVAADEFDDARRGWTAGQVWAAMQVHLPLAPDPVVTHGDFSLDNIMIGEGAVVGCIDLGRVGVADRYQDVAIAWHSLGEFGAGAQRAFLRAYGIERPDQGKLDFHLMLDEMF